MLRLLIQLKTVIRDKIALLSFSLPIITAIIVLVIGDNSIAGIDTHMFGVVTNNLDKSTIRAIDQLGVIHYFDNVEQLIHGINDPSNEVIGIMLHDDNLEVLVSGDETSRTTELAKNIVFMLNRSKENVVTNKILAANEFSEFKDIIFAMIILMSLFIGSTFNVMNVISEKESGINRIYGTLPTNSQNYLIEKVIIGFLSSVIVSMLTITILMGDMMKVLIMLPLAIIVSLITSVIGLLLGIISDGFVIGISYIKLLMVAFMAIPIVEHMLIKNNTVKMILNILPPVSTFNGIIAVFNDEYSLLFYSIMLLLLNCMFLLFIYKFLYRKGNIRT